MKSEKSSASHWAGKKHKEETKLKIGVANSISQAAERNSQFGKIWITDGIQSIKINATEVIPEGWNKGRVNSHKQISITNGITNKLINANSVIPIGWEEGSVTKFINITNGIENKRVLRVDGIPSGWNEGKTKIKKKSRNAGTIWVNNGIINKRVMSNIVLEDGWKKGKI